MTVRMLLPQAIPDAPTRRLPRMPFSWPVQLAAIISAAFYAHMLVWWTPPRDLTVALDPWYSHILHYGPMEAFAHPFSNYTPPYLYLLAVASLGHNLLASMHVIKLLSLAGTVFLALAVADLLKAMEARPRYAVLIFVLPSVVLNAALLAQCDALWAGAAILAISAIIRGRTVRSLVWCGVAIAFKAQAAFIAPFIIGALVGRRAPLWQWLIPTAVFVAWMLPAWLMGWPAQQLAMVYPGQAGTDLGPGRLANPWIAATIYAPDTAKSWFVLGYAAAAAAAVAIVTLTSRSVGNKRVMLILALLSAMALPFLLPKMLERYYFLADVLALVLALSCRSRPAVLIAVCIQIASFLSLLTYWYFYLWPFLTLLGAFFAAAALAITCVLALDNEQADFTVRSLRPRRATAG